MEDNNSESGGAWIAFVVAFIISYLIFSGSGNYEGQTAEDWFNEYDAVIVENEELRNLLQEANEQIKTVNSSIVEAQSYSGESYEDMEDALNNLSIVDTVEEP